MSRWLWIVLAVSVSTTVYFTIRYGLRPKPIPVMNPTKFESLDQIGVVIYKRLHQNIRAERLVVLGSSPNLKDYDHVWAGLLQMALTNKKQKVAVFNHESLSADWVKKNGLTATSFSSADLDSDSLIKKLKDMVSKGQLIFVHLPTIESSHLVNHSLSKRLDPVLRQPVLALSTLRFAINQDELDEIQSQCLDTSEDPRGLRRLECAANKVARKFVKKRLSTENIWSVVERHGLKEYLVFIHQPSQQ